MADQIFSRQQYDALKAAERELSKALELVEKHEACGEDCSGYRGVIDSFRDKLSAFEQQFMSPPPK